MQAIYDGNLTRPVAIGNPRVTYPVTNLTDLYLVTQEYVQLASTYSTPSFGVGHYLYPQAKFCEETSFGDHGGGLVRFTWVFAQTSGVTQTESVIEAINFPGYKYTSYPYTETYRVINEQPDGGFTSEIKTVTKYAYNLIIREPFSEAVECTKVTRYLNIFEGQGSSSSTSYSKSQLQSAGSILYRGATARVSFVNDVLVLSVGGQEINIAPQDGRYYIASNVSSQSDYYRGAFAINSPEIIYDAPDNKVAEEIATAYNAQREEGSQTYSYDPPRGLGDRVVTNFVTNTSIPNLSEYQARIGTYGMLVRPTEIEQFKGSVYKVSETTTVWK